MGKKRKDEEDEDIQFGAEVDDPDEEQEALPVSASAELNVELTAKEKLELEAEARAEVAMALKKAKMRDFKVAAKKRLQAEALFSEGKDETGKDLMRVDMDIASYPKWIMLDGKRFHHNRSYRVRPGVAAVLLDQMDRGWRQEEARLGEKSEYSRQTRKTLNRDGRLVETVLH